MRKEDKLVAIRIKSLKKAFRNHKKDVVVFRNLNLEIMKNETISLFGPSGCGKTTLLRIIAGLTQTDDGEIEFSQKRFKLGYVFQEPRLLPWRTVAQNIELVLNEDHERETATKRKSVRKALELVQLSEFENRYPEELSGGEKQRISIARALVIKPDILLMDEPFSHLDELTATELRIKITQIIKRVKVTMIFATHNPLEAIFLADRIVVFTKKKPTSIKRIVNINVPGKRSKDLYREFIFHRRVKPILQQLLSKR